MLNFWNEWELKNNHQILSSYLLQCSLISSDTLDETDGKGIQLISLMSLVYDRQRNAEAQVPQVSHFFGQRDNLGEEIHFQLQHIAASGPRTHAFDREDTSSHAEISCLHLTSPIIEDLLRRQLHTKAIAIGL